MYKSNLYGSFEQVVLKVPDNQNVFFNNITETIELRGFYNQNLTNSVDFVNFLNLSKGDYVLTLCYECSSNKSYMVVFR